MLRELDVLHPKGFRERMDKKTRTIHNWEEEKNWFGIDKWSNDELHRPIRRKFEKSQVFASGVDAIWTADLVDMQPFCRSNKVFKYILMKQSPPQRLIKE